MRTFRRVADELPPQTSSGSWVLSATGLLDGRRATTNKSWFKKIAEATTSHNIQWVPKARWVVDGKFWTASGVSAGECLVLTTRIHRYIHLTASLYPSVVWRPLITLDLLLTSTLGMDMANALVKQLIGEEGARLVANDIEMRPRSADDDEFAAVYGLA